MTYSIIAIGHWFSSLSRFKRTTSPTSKFCCLSFDFYLNWSWHKSSFLHLAQNSLAMCWGFLILHLLKKTGLSKTQDGNKTTFDFMVRMLSDTNGSNHITDCVHFSWTRIQYCLWLCYPNLQGFSGKTFAIIVNQTSKYCYWRVNLHFPNPITMIFTCTWFFAQIIQLAPFKSENLFTLWFCLRDAFP